MLKNKDAFDKFKQIVKDSISQDKTKKIFTVFMDAIYYDIIQSSAAILPNPTTPLPEERPLLTMEPNAIDYNVLLDSILNITEDDDIKNKVEQFVSDLTENKAQDRQKYIKIMFIFWINNRFIV